MLLMEFGDLPFKELVLGFMWSIYVWEQYLSLRQLRNLRDPTMAVPESLKAHVADDVHKKSKAYGADKAYFSLFTALYSQVQTTLVIVYDVLPIIWEWSRNLLVDCGLVGDRPILQSIVFVLVMMISSSLLQVPVSFFSTFVIEQRHGFNKQTIGLFFSDFFKELALTFVIASPVVAGMLLVIQWGGENFFLYVWLFMLSFQIIMVIVYPTLIQPLFNTFKPLDEGELKTMINALAARIHFPLSKIFVVDGSKRSSHSNAYFFGFFKNKRIVLYDTLLEHSNNDEICGVLAHELGHWKLSHTYKMLAVAQVQLFAIFFLFSRVINSAPMYEAFGFSERPVIIGLLLFSYLYQPVDALTSFCINAMSRVHEFQADAFAKKLGYTSTLSSALIKLHLKNLGNLNPDSLYSMWHYSHPPLVERLAAIADTKKTD